MTYCLPPDHARRSCIASIRVLPSQTGLPIKPTAASVRVQCNQEATATCYLAPNDKGMVIIQAMLVGQRGSCPDKDRSKLL